PRSELVSSVTPGWLPGERTIDPNNGFTSQALGHRAALDLIHLRLPWWNPYEGTGAPLAGELQSAALFPPTLLALFSNGQLYEHVLLEMIAGLSTYLLLRRLLLGLWASAAGATAFALNGTFAWLSHAPVNPVALLPALLLGVELAYAARHAGTRAGSGHLPAQALSQLVLPYVYGPIVAFGDPKLTLTGIWDHVGGFLSTSLLLFAVLGLLSKGRRGLRLILLGWIMLALARIYGEPRLLSDAVGVLPG